MGEKKYRLKPSELRSICDPKSFKFKTTSESKPLEGVIGQERAVQALEFGIHMNSPGYNIFVTGIEGTGKSTIVRDFVKTHARNLETPSDWCMVNNFVDAYCPKTVQVPSGKAVQFAKKMDRTIEDLRKDLPKTFASETFQKKKSDIQKKYSALQHEVFKDIEQEAKKKEMQVNQTADGFQTIVLVDNAPISREDYNNLPEKKRRKIEGDLQLLNSRIEAAAREINRLSQSLHGEIEKLLDEQTLSVVGNRFDPFRKEYAGWPDILSYLDAVEANIIENVQEFLPSETENAERDKVLFQIEDSAFKKYRVNVLVDQGRSRGAPVIFESNPTYVNVFGQIEKRAVMGAVTTDFSMVQAGSLLRANGGYLIMEIDSVLNNNFVWDALKRALQNKCLSIEDMATELGFATASLRPEPIPLEVKVILLGGYYPFQVLQDYDSKFNKFFKVRADFDHEVVRTEETVQQYAGFIARVCQEEALLPFTASGVATVVEFGEKIVADKSKLSLRFGAITGVLREADYWARKRRARSVTEKDVVRAFEEHRFRHNLYEEKVHESYIDRTIMVDVGGEVVGQVNALAVYQVGDISFGRPSRITAETYMGKEGIINIERESKLSGKTHDKGVLILTGFLGRTFAQSYPLALACSITFEQSYGEIDGDSASSTELYAIVSSLAGVPIRQGIAVTGSVNQKGKIQAIGGVNQKIEGFYEVCKARGLTGQQGVIIPRSNVKNLMLKREIVKAVRGKTFNIYAVSTVEEGLEILTGCAVGTRDTDGNYPAETVFGRAQARLKSYIERSIQMKKGLDADAADPILLD